MYTKQQLRIPSIYQLYTKYTKRIPSVYQAYQVYQVYTKQQLRAGAEEEARCSLFSSGCEIAAQSVAFENVRMATHVDVHNLIDVWCICLLNLFWYFIPIDLDVYSSFWLFQAEAHIVFELFLAQIGDKIPVSSRLLCKM